MFPIQMDTFSNGNMFVAVTDGGTSTWSTGGVGVIAFAGINIDISHNAKAGWLITAEMNYTDGSIIWHNFNGRAESTPNSYKTPIYNSTGIYNGNDYRDMDVVVGSDDVAHIIRTSRSDYGHNYWALFGMNQLGEFTYISTVSYTHLRAPRD